MREQWLLRLATYFLFGLAFVGFVIYPNVLYPDVFTKGLYVRFLILAALLFFSWRVFLRKEKLSIAMTPLAWAVLSFGGAAVVSMFFSTSIFRSFWGEAQRMEGVLGLLHYVILFFVVREVFGKQDWRTYFKCVLVSVPLLSLYAIFQYVSARTGVAFPLVLNPVGNPGSLFGNPGFFSTFLIFAAGFGVIFLALEESAPWRAFAGGAVAIAVGMIVWLGVRGQVLGMIIGIVAFAAFTVLREKKGRRVTAFLVGVGLLVAVGVGLIALRPSLGKFYPRVVTRIINLPNEPSFHTRWLSLQSSGKAFLDSPKTMLIGWGQEHFMTGYNKYYNSLHGTYEDAWFDRAHNKLADVLVTGGALGLLVYLWLWGGAGRRVFLLMKDPRSAGVAVGVGALLVAYFTQNLTTFDLPQTYANFFILLAFLDVYHRSGAPVPGELATDQGNKPIGYVLRRRGVFVAAMTIVVVSTAVFTILIPLRQSERYLAYFKSHKGNEFFENWDSVFSLKSFVHYTIVDDMWRRLQDQNALRDPNFLPVTDLLVKEMKYFMDRDPTDAQMALRLGSVYTNQGIGLMSSGGDAETRLKEGEAYTRRALALSPGRQEIYYVLAFNLQGQGEKEEAVRIMQDALALNPSTRKARYYLAVNQALVGKLDEAVRAIEEVRSAGWFQGFRPAEAREIIRIYQAAKRDDLLPGLYIEFLRDGRNKDPEVFVLLLRILIREKDRDRLMFWANEYKIAHPQFTRVMDELIDLAREGKWEKILPML